MFLWLAGKGVQIRIVSIAEKYLEYFNLKCNIKPDV